MSGACAGAPSPRDPERTIRAWGAVGETPPTRSYSQAQAAAATDRGVKAVFRALERPVGSRASAGSLESRNPSTGLKTRRDGETGVTIPLICDSRAFQSSHETPKRAVKQHRRLGAPTIRVQANLGAIVSRLWRNAGNQGSHVCRRTGSRAPLISLSFFAGAGRFGVMIAVVQCNIADVLGGSRRGETESRFHKVLKLLWFSRPPIW